MQKSIAAETISSMPSSAYEAQDVAVRKRASFGFVLTLLALTFEYARPQDKIHVIGMLRPGLILALLMLAASLASGRMRTAICQQTTRMFLLLFLMALYVPFALNNFIAYSVTLNFFLLFPLVVSIILFVDSLDRLRLLIKYLSFLAMYISINGIVGSGVAGSSFLGDENDFALLMNSMLPFVLCLSVYEKRRITKVVYLAISISCVVGVVVSNSRGGFVGLLAVFFVLWLGSTRKLLSLGLVGVLAAVIYVAANQTYWDDMATIQNTEEGTAKERFDTWEAAWEMFKDHPLGVGPGNFPIRFPEYQPASMRRNMWGRQAHSLWFTLLPELGILGMILYFSLLRINVKDVLRLRRIAGDDDERRFFSLLSLALAASFTGYFVSGSFLSVLYYPHYWYLTAMLAAAKRVADSVSTKFLYLSAKRV